MTEQTKITLQDMIDRGLNPAGWTVVADGSGNFILTAPSGGPGGGGVDQIGMYALQDGVPFGTGTWLDLGDNLNASLSGTVLALDGYPPGVDQIGVYIQDEGIGQQTGTILNFVGSEVTVSVSGTIAQVSVGDPAGGTGTTVVFDEDSLVGSFSEMRYKGEGVDVYNSGTYAAIDIPSGGQPYRVRARRTSTNNFVNGWTIAWQTTDWNDLNMWTGSSATRITVPFDGVVQVDATAGFNAAGGSGRWWMAIYHNGSRKFYHSSHLSDWNGEPHASVGGSYEVSAGDYFEVQLWNLSGSGKSSSTSCNITLLFWPD